MKKSPTQVVCSDFQLSRNVKVTLSYTPSSSMFNDGPVATLSIGFTDSYDSPGGINLTPDEMFALGTAMHDFTAQYQSAAGGYKEGA
jgi:hypothetical protein